MTRRTNDKQAVPGRRHASQSGGRWPLVAHCSPGVRCGEMIFVGGQAALDTAGEALAPSDIERQTGVVVERVGAVLNELGAGIEDLVALAIYYVPGAGFGDDQALSLLRRALGPAPMPAVNLIPVPYLALPGLRLMIEALAMRGVDGTSLPRTLAEPARHSPWPAGGAFAHGVRCGEMIFVSGQSARDGGGCIVGAGDIVRQSEQTMENLASVLGEFGADLNDAVRFNIFYRGDGRTEDWEVAARVRARYFTEPGPATTGIPVPEFPDGETLIRMGVWAMRGADGARLARDHVWPEGHWDWSFHLPYKHGLKCRNLIFIGGQVPTDQKLVALAKGDIVAQTHIAMGYLSRVLQNFGLPLDAVVKINGYYADRSGSGAMARNMGVRQSFFAAPGPVTSEVALPFLAADDMAVEIEAVAVMDEGA